MLKITRKMQNAMKRSGITRDQIRKLQTKGLAVSQLPRMGFSDRNGNIVALRIYFDGTKKPNWSDNMTDFMDQVGILKEKYAGKEY